VTIAAPIRRMPHQWESMISVERRNDQLDAITSLCFDHIW